MRGGVLPLWIELEMMQEKAPLHFNCRPMLGWTWSRKASLPNCFRINDLAKHDCNALFLMPVLISGSVAPYSFRQLARCFLSRFHVAQARRCHDFAVASPVQETSLKGDAQEDEPRIRERKHGFRALPVSPLMIGDGKRRQRRPIIQQDDALKEFQKEVALNPYGTTTTDVFTCTPKTDNLSSTSTRNPNPILQSHPNPPPLSLPNPLHHNHRTPPSYHRKSVAQIESSHKTRVQYRL
jgi:hypothetical protein